MTDAGPIDVLRELRDHDGRDVPLTSCGGAVKIRKSAVLSSTSPGSTTSSPPGSTPSATRITKHFQSSENYATPAEVSAAGDGDLDSSRGDSAPNRQITRSVIAKPYEQEGERYPAKCWTFEPDRPTGQSLVLVCLACSQKSISMPIDDRLGVGGWNWSPRCCAQ